MTNLFDRLKVQAFGITSRLMGYPATWSPSEGGPVQTCQINFKGPTEILEILDMEYNPNHFAMEYMVGMFPGLKESSDANGTEVVAITKDGVVTEYYVRIVRLIVDGDKYLATLELKE